MRYFSRVALGALTSLMVAACAHAVPAPESDGPAPYDDGDDEMATSGALDGYQGGTQGAHDLGGDQGTQGGTGASGPGTSTSASSSSTSAGSTSAGSTSGGSTSGGSTSSGSPGGQCDASGSCQQCFECAVQADCAGEVDACLNNGECAALDQCLYNCQDDACADQCWNAHPGGQAAYDNAMGCVICGACSQDCQQEAAQSCQ